MAVAAIAHCVLPVKARSNVRCLQRRILCRLQGELEARSSKLKLYRVGFWLKMLYGLCMGGILISAHGLSFQDFFATFALAAARRCLLHLVQADKRHANRVSWRLDSKDGSEADWVSSRDPLATQTKSMHLKGQRLGFSSGQRRGHTLEGGPGHSC